MSNPLLNNFNTPFQSIPFEKIKLNHYMPAFIKGIKEGEIEIEKIKNNPEKATFKNTIEALERNGELLGSVSTVFFNLNSSETSDEMQALAQEVSPLLTEYSNNIMMDDVLFKKVKSVFENKKNETLNKEQEYLLEKTYKGFERSGANLNKKDKSTLKKYNTELSKLSLTFSENLLKDAAQFELWISDEGDLKGLPQGAIEAAAMMAKAKNKEGQWLFTLDYPSYIPFMKYSENRELRKKMSLAFGSRGFAKNQYNNEANVLRISELKHLRAQLLGYKSHATFTLKERMAEKPEKVFELWDELFTKAQPMAIKELAEVQKMSDKLKGPSPLQSYDFSYYAEKLKDEKFAINDKLLKPYFSLEKVLNGAFETAKKLYGIQFKPIDNIQKYHPDVSTYEVLDKDNNHLAVFYADFFPREGKRNGAWMTSFRDQNKYDNKEQRPLISIVCNFTKPTETKPSLLTFNEVTTLFHEFGHALHGIFANGYYESLSGTNVFWDFVELPSQILENWCYEKECLDLFANHYQTGDTIPMELVQKIKDSANFLSAYQTLRQIGLGKLDMAWHHLDKVNTQKVIDFEKEHTASTSLFPFNSKTCTSCAFSHIFAGGYSAGYYSYKWAEVLEADAFEYFQEKGIFNPAVGQSFRDNILSKGGSMHPMTLYKKFRGKEPSTKALLKKSGLI